jgi:hypothetical protein
LNTTKEGGSEKHIRDILGVLKIRGAQIDRDYISDWARQLNLVEQWELILSRFAPQE